MLADNHCRVRTARAAKGMDPSCLGYGRFVQTDPLGYDDGLNWYNYAGNDPMNEADPTGTFSACTGSLLADFEKGQCGSVNRLSINGIDAATAQMMQEGALHDLLPGASDGTVRQTLYCLADPRCLADKLRPDRHEFRIDPYWDYTTGDLVVTGPKEISDGSKWVWLDGRSRLNPNYHQPAYDIGLDGFLTIEIGLYAVAASLGITALTARGGVGWLNRNNYLKYGYSWRGTAQAGEDVFRIAIGRRWGHIDLLPTFRIKFGS